MTDKASEQKPKQVVMREVNNPLVDSGHLTGYAACPNGVSPFN